MTLEEVLSNLKTNTLPNITKLKQMEDSNLTSVVNEGILTLHNIFNIRQEQAIILVPAFRNVFKISNKDPNVIMASYAKIAECSVKGNYKTKSEILEAVIKEDKKKETILDNEEESTEIFATKHDEVLKILSIDGEDPKRPHHRHCGRFNFKLNEENVFAIDQLTLYFPHCKEGDMIYVEYKPKPIKASVTAKTEEIDLPDTLLNCLYAFVPLKIITGIQGMTQFYPNVLNTYNAELQKAMTEGAVVPLGLTFKHLKGFI